MSSRTRTAEATGFDFSPYALAAARRDRSGRYVEWDIDAGPLPRELRPGSMDIVTFRDSLQWLPVYRLLHDVHRVPRPGGALHIQDNPRTNPPSARGTDEAHDMRFGQRLAATDVTALRTLQGWRTHRLVRTGDAATLVLHRDCPSFPEPPRLRPPANRRRATPGRRAPSPAQHPEGRYGKPPQAQAPRLRRLSVPPPLPYRSGSPPSPGPVLPARGAAGPALSRPGP